MSEPQAAFVLVLIIVSIVQAGTNAAILTWVLVAALFTDNGKANARTALMVGGAASLLLSVLSVIALAIFRIWLRENGG